MFPGNLTTMHVLIDKRELSTLELEEKTKQYAIGFLNIDSGHMLHVDFEI